ncbi:class A beta-lactamase-related serine hydrolase [Sporosarcina sp. ACRSL]|uniref:serine hydrolase n=1 Tax=Sporosarcina sp. ACRSL TaxID=2918215 RepID=UPI001EF4F3EC|nr:serine hydrolase [Sporosarcina sp. ACRSL]MCG7345602.1 class A beta-lactamase-related serine hydrolase [Sporosarcina sp. ACRSL]
MNMLAWIGMLTIIILTPLPLLIKENRTKEEIRKVIVTEVIALAIIIAVLFFSVNYLLALVVGFIALILFNKKTYTKKRLITYGAIILVVGIAGYSVFRDNPDYVLNHLKENPQTTSFYLAENGVELIAYQSDVVRPLASTVKMLIAVEYAMQIDAGLLDKDSTVSLDELSRYYVKDTDGNAHVEWLKAMESEGKVVENKVTLHDVAKGMVTYSSNVNTDYLIDLLGAASINERAKSLGLTEHEEVYPIVSALLIPEYLKSESSESMNNNEIISEIESMPIDEYREIAVKLSKQMKEGTIKSGDYTYELPLKVQRVWSDRLIGASANDYGKLLEVITKDQLPMKAAETARDLLEWPMQLYEGNHKRFVHLGAKGGSTAFVLNDAMYAEDHNGNKIEMVILTDDLSLWQGILLRNNLNSFKSKLLGSKEYRLKVQKDLSEL